MRVVVPDERPVVIEFVQEELPGIALMNGALVEFEPKQVFRWHLSVMVEFENLIENGMPSRGERELVDPFGDSLDAQLKGPDPAKPSALFLARITWNATRELVYRVFEAEVANRTLEELISARTYPREFDYRIDDDPQWELAKWHLDALRGDRPS